MVAERTESRAQEVTEGFGQSGTIAKFFLDNRKGPYLDVEQLVHIEGDTLLKRNYGQREWACRALDNINIYGNGAIVHLCLPDRIRYALMRADVRTISSLRDTLDDIIAGQVRFLSEVSAQLICDRLSKFDEALAKSQLQ